MSQLLSESDILFPHLSNTPNLSTTLLSLKRSTLSIHNRLNSIVLDSQFVTSVASAYHLPLVANERCGSWYIPTDQKTEGVYFKSTDGHISQWGFSLRRLNLQLLDVVENYRGAVIVDSTRRGKSMPDALSKTVPIWCCVINRAVFGQDHKHELSTPPHVVGKSEHAQIESRIDGFVKQFLDICKPAIPTLRSKIQKPLRPIWVTQESPLPDFKPSFPDFHPIVLCTASRRANGAEGSGSGYIQGAADDHEAWSHGLTPPLFWKHRDLLMRTSEEEAPNVIARLTSEETQNGTAMKAILIKPTFSLYVSSSHNVDTNGYDVVISCTSEPLASKALNNKKNHYLHLICQTGKLGSRDLRNQLPQLSSFIEKLTSSSPKILVCCPTGKDVAVGTALTILCLYTNNEGTIDLQKRRKAEDINKNLIKQRLSWITTSNPALNASRATLQSVNAVLLESQDPKALHKSPSTQHSLPIRAKQITPTATTTQQPINTTPPPPSLPHQIFTNLPTPPSHPWTFHRTLRSALPTHPSGTVTGTATFTPCSLPSPAPPTLLYAEEGEFVTDTGLRFSARRKYVYQLQKEGIVVKFFDDEKLPAGSIGDGVGEKGEGVGGVFVEMGLIKLVGKEGGNGVGHSGKGGVYEAQNKEQHLCAEDVYTASWKFSGDMVRDGKEGKEGKGKGMWWEVRYDVKGPQKDYVSVTRYDKK